MGKTPKFEATIETDKFIAIAEAFLSFIPKENHKEGTKSFIPCRVRRIVINCKRSGNTFKFCMTVRKGVTNISDSRRQAMILKSITMAELRTDLERMMGKEHACKLIDTMTMS